MGFFVCGMLCRFGYGKVYIVTTIYWGCENKDDACPANYEPVCGSDGVTYGNDYYAENAGVTEWTAGECE